MKILLETKKFSIIVDETIRSAVGVKGIEALVISGVAAYEDGHVSRVYYEPLLGTRTLKLRKNTWAKCLEKLGRKIITGEKLEV